ncbi:MAG TPA: hypothetical protein VHE35_11885 [Kofleriaceae bacterium]|nr:hypothetical protein [Kofleriaceae bacterium]
MRSSVVTMWMFGALAALPACSGGDPGAQAPSDGPAQAIDAKAPADAPAAIDAPPPIDAAVARDVRCGDPAPPGAPMPAPLPSYSGGTCPTLVPGRNTIRSSGREREFLLVVPPPEALTQPRPLMFMWHWLNASANSVLTRGDVQNAADRLHFFAAIPESSPDLAVTIPFVGSFDPQWPYLTITSDARTEQEAVFFDDMLACISQQYAIDASCVSTFGVSAGALWSAQLVQRRSTRLASALILSGGVGPATGIQQLEVKGWSPTVHKLPVLVAWGGMTDQCGANFQNASHNLEMGLEAGGHAIIECVHNCGHAEPPIDDPMGLQVLYQVALDHPFWLDPGETPYAVRGLPMGMPAWCALGAGNATPRTGDCPGGTFNINSCPVPALPQ